MRRKIVSFLELSLMILSIFAFSYLISNSSINLVSAESEIQKGCCLETVEGAICQNIPMFQSGLCKDNLVGTSCEVIDQCQLGCCYSSNSGTCAIKAPKNQCIANGGNWSSDSLCNIPQCQLGCCIMGDQVSLTNSRECTLMSNKFNFEKNFIPVSSGQSCEQYVGLEKEGACLSDSGDYSGEKNCIFTTKKNCVSGEFKENYLCTSEELNTICEKTEKTTCLEGKDQVYFLDSCGNVANVYDSSKVNDQSYWEKPINPEDSCSSEGPGCGNCNYLQGSVCVRHEQGVTQKPTYGDYTCKNLNCGNRKQGESWCVYDFNPNSGVAPIGSRHFVASCFEGKISIEGCADFNQEVCAQSTDTSFGFTEAKCLVNDWRSCINANDADSYSEVKKKCDQNPQCIMFNELYGEENLKRSDGEFFAGFDPEKTNAEQGSIEGLGSDQNNILTHCVPRFTPGFQFWTTNGQVVSSAEKNSDSKSSSADYGGSDEETDAICSLGSFTCVSQINRECTLAGGCDSWEDHRLNWECNYDGVHSTIKGQDLPKFMNAMNERCRSSGSCGVSTNIAGVVNEDYPGFSVERINIDNKGNTHEDYSTEGYNLSSDYISGIKRKTSVISNLDELGLGSEGLVAEVTDSAGTTGEPSQSFIDLKQMAAGANVDLGEGSFGDMMMGVTILAGIGTPFMSGLLGIATAGMTYSSGALVHMTWSSWGSSMAFTAVAAGIGAVVGYQIGKLISKNQDWSPGKANQFNKFMAATGAAIGAGVGIALTTGVSTGAAASSAWGAAGAIFLTNPIGWIILVAAIVYMVYTAFIETFEEQEYFIMRFTCESWQPPKHGECEICNDDVRSCSEYRCKSLGSNCHYFIENGEPGYCASVNEIWSAQITPWQEILTGGNEYSSIGSNGFRIQGLLGQGVNAWESLTFGIVTDKPATCKIDSQHTQDYNDMAYEMFSPVNPDTGKSDGTHHQIGLNAFTGGNNSETTLGLAQGEENEYYIRCMNFAGQINEAEFVVQAKVKDGPDLTPPELIRFEPVSGSHLKQGTNSTDIVLFLNEPADCRFDYEYDTLSGQEYFEDLRHEMFCLTSPSSAFFGEWRCLANLENLTVGENNLYFRCKDQPNLEETESYPRNANFVSTNYKLDVCSSGLNISLLNSNMLIEEKSFTLNVATSGCVGDAICSFRMSNYSNQFNVFFETGGKIHSQLLTPSLGEHEIEVSCEDEAGNTANKTFKFTVIFDDTPPEIVRAINTDGEIKIVTNEPAECVYETNISNGCNFGFEGETTSYLSTEHKFNSNVLENYFIKCRDKKLNLPSSCSIILKPISLGNK